MKLLKRPFLLTAAAAITGAVAWGTVDLTLTAQNVSETATPIKHVVVIFGENVSFDHYFGAYPKALNPIGQPRFMAKQATPAVNGLTEELLKNNPNFTNPVNAAGATNPFRLDRTQAFTADQSHGYQAEQQAFNNGAMDMFPRYTGNTGAVPGPGPFHTKGLVMGYYDGNTVTALWNYAQNFALSDNSFGTTFGPSTPGAINLISGQTNGGVRSGGEGEVRPSTALDDGFGGLTIIGDPDPSDDACSTTRSPNFMLTGRNIGDLLNEKKVSWGWFQGGFDLTVTNPNGTTGCARTSYSPIVGSYVKDYMPHHEPFQYYRSTANPKHVRPKSVVSIGTSDDAGANHQYDINDFYAAVSSGNFPAVSFLKALGIQDGHPGLSDPLDEQTFITTVLNFLQKSPEWKSTAVILAYDDSDGWYDHAARIVNSSYAALDLLSGSATCDAPAALPGVAGKPVNGRCGHGPRLPLLVVSPYAKPNFVDHTPTDQTSIIRFIEDNWLGGQRIGNGSFDERAGVINNMFDFSGPTNSVLLLDTNTGLPLK